MKKYITLPIIIALFAACSQFTGKRDSKQPQTAFTPDSLWTPTGNAQLDSLLQLAAVAPQDTNLVKLYDKIAVMYINNDYEKAKEYYLKLNSLSERLGWNHGRIQYYNGFSSMLQRTGFGDSAIVVLRQGLELARLENDEIAIATFLGNIGGIYRAKEWYETSLDYYLEALRILEGTNNFRLKNLYISISLTYGGINNVEKAVEYGEKALALDSENEMALFALAVTYLTSAQYDKAVFYLEKALLLCEAKNNNYVKGYVYRNLSICALADFDLEKAEKYARLSLELTLQSGPDTYCTNYVLFSRLEQMKGNYDRAESYIREALKIATEYNKLSEKRNSYQILAELAIAKRNYRESIQYLTEVDLVETEIAHEKILHASEEMAAKYETEKKELEIERQQEVISRQNMQRWLLAAGIAVCMLFLALLWYMLHLRTRRNHALAEMNATKDKFFSIISHDLKNPAVSQRDAIQLLVKNDRVWDADTLTGYYAGLLTSADGQVELLYNLLNWAKIQTGRMTYTPAAFGLVAHLRSDLSLIRNMAEKKGIALDVKIPDNALVTGDSNMLITVLRNLLTNAVKFTASGGTVALEITQNQPDNASAATTHTFTISDTGTGMSAAQISNLFNLDSAHSGRGTAGEQGSGLGLIVCKELLEKHGSILHIESEEGKGSRFWFAI